MDFVTTKEIAERWGISVRRVQVLCDRGKVEGARKLADMWIIPKDTPKPIDGRKNNGRRLDSVKSKENGGAADD